MPKDRRRFKNPGSEQDLRESLPPEIRRAINLFVTIKTWPQAEDMCCPSPPPYVKSKSVPREGEVAQGVRGRLRSRIITAFGTTRLVGSQLNAPAVFTPGEIPGTHFQRLSRPQGTWFCRKEPRKKSQVTPPGIDPGTARLVAQHLNHYATPGPYLHM